MKEFMKISLLPPSHTDVGQEILLVVTFIWLYVIGLVKFFREEFHGVVMSLEKIHRDGKQLVQGGSWQPSVKHLQQRVGVKPCLQDCLDGLMILYEMHCSEYAISLFGKMTFFLADA